MCRGGFADDTDLAGELTGRYGGNLSGNALYIRDLTHTTDRLAGDMAGRLRKIGAITELPREFPIPSSKNYGSKRYVRSCRFWPDGASRDR